MPLSQCPTVVASILDHQTLDLVLASPDLAHEVAGFVRGDGARDDRTADTACTAERHLALDVNVRDLKEHIVSHTSCHPQRYNVRSCLRTEEAGAAGSPAASCRRPGR